MLEIGMTGRYVAIVWPENRFDLEQGQINTYICTSVDVMCHHMPLACPAHALHMSLECY